MCRSWSAGPYFGVHHKGAMTFEGQEHIGIYKSSAWAQRGFCKKCGASIFFKFFGNDTISISAGMFVNPTKLKTKMNIFIKGKLDYYKLDKKLPKFNRYS